MVEGSAGVRIFRPRRSAGWLIGRLLLLMWRMPLSHQPSEIRPTPSSFFAISCPIGPSMTRYAAWLVGYRKGRPKAASSGTTVEIGPWLFTDMSRVPVLSPVNAARSSPSCAAPATRSSIRPFERSRSCCAMRSAATLRGLPAAALWPRVSRTWPWPRATAGAASAPAAASSALRRVMVSPLGTAWVPPVLACFRPFRGRISKTAAQLRALPPPFIAS